VKAAHAFLRVAIGAALVGACAGPSATGPAATNAAPPAKPSGDGALIAIDDGLEVDATATDEERARVRTWHREAQSALASFFGPEKREWPLVQVCKTDSCARQILGPTRRSRAFMKPSPRVGINGIDELTRGTIVHEIIHIEIAKRSVKQRVPTWFDEGVATFVGDNAPCPPATPRAIDDLRRLDMPRAWEGFTNMTGKMKPAYCQARAEIAAWVEKHGRADLLRVVDAVGGGGSFDEAYGPLLTTIAPEAFSHVLDASFPLDENTGTDVADASGRFHMGALMSGAIWTAGRHGAAVKVMNGSYVRADGLTSFAVPDSPFTIALFVKPLVDAKTLIHTSAPASGGNGWCTPLLGHDAQGHLVAQVPFATDPKAFLTATGPVLPLGQWSHVAVTWTAVDGVALFVDGERVATGAPKNASERHRDAAATPTYLFVGSTNGSHCWTSGVENGDWNGAVDELRVYDYALTQEELRAAATH
jgi:hypothetical protein